MYVSLGHLARIAARLGQDPVVIGRQYFNIYDLVGEDAQLGRICCFVVEQHFGSLRVRQAQRLHAAVEDVETIRGGVWRVCIAWIGVAGGARSLTAGRRLRSRGGVTSAASVVHIAGDSLVVIGLYAHSADLTAKILEYLGAVVVVIKLGVDKVNQALQVMILQFTRIRLS